ncbi:hypothetical protein IGJ55_001010 [Enterococcus sp. AZ170]|uniref:hypothetical protein n=1 Tax=unclassified Enterococcus TaxID=2608891 RepID=UPI003D271D7C
MKKKVRTLLCGILLIGGITFGGFYAYASGWITVGDNGEMIYDTIDQASIDLYSDVSHVRSYDDGEWVSVLKPEDVVKSVKNRAGKQVDFSELEISYKAYDDQLRKLVDVSEKEALNDNGTFNFDKYNVFHVTFEYTYDSMPYTGADKTMSTISKTIEIYEAGA